MRPRDSRLEGVYAAASNGTTNLHDAWVEALKPTTWSNVQRGYKAYMKARSAKPAAPAMSTPATKVSTKRRKPAASSRKPSQATPTRRTPHQAAVDNTNEARRSDCQQGHRCMLTCTGGPRVLKFACTLASVVRPALVPCVLRAQAGRRREVWGFTCSSVGRSVFPPVRSGRCAYTWYLRCDSIIIVTEVKAASRLASERRVQLLCIACKPGLVVRRRNGRSRRRTAHRFHVPISALSGSAARSEPVRQRGP